VTSLLALDAAFTPDLAAVQTWPHGTVLAINGYLTGTYADSTTQPKAARKAGLGFVPTYEEGPSELVGASRATGRGVGRKILAAFKAKGLPLDGSVAVYPSVDVRVPIDGTDHDADQCNSAWQGIRDIVAGQISVRAYAEGAIIDALASAGLVDGPCWLAAPTSWPGYSVEDKHICMVQLDGDAPKGTDANHIITNPAALGAWWPDGSPYGGDMPLTDADVAKVVNAIFARDIIPAPQQTPAEAEAAKTNPTWALVSALGSVLAHTHAHTRDLADITPRIASLQAELAATQAEVAALKQQAQPVAQAADIPVTITGSGTVHMGGTQ
jgi:hypothetical protein